MVNGRYWVFGIGYRVLGICDPYLVLLIFLLSVEISYNAIKLSCDNTDQSNQQKQDGYC